jgi:hypothetical protein
MDFKSESLPIINTNNGILRKTIIAQKSSIPYVPIQSSKTLPKLRLSLKPLQPKLDKSILENESTIHLLDKIKQSANAESVGPMPLSLQVS